MQDKDRMKEFEKIKIQLEQLIEFKSKVMESQVLNYLTNLLKIYEKSFFIVVFSYRLVFNASYKGRVKKPETHTQLESSIRTKWQISPKRSRWPLSIRKWQKKKPKLCKSNWKPSKRNSKNKLWIWKFCGMKCLTRYLS